jgi:hypothetical protein
MGGPSLFGKNIATECNWSAKLEYDFLLFGTQRYELIFPADIKAAGPYRQARLQLPVRLEPVCRKVLIGRTSPRGLLSPRHTPMLGHIA